MAGRRAWFDYLNLRTNGYDFHMELTNGEVPWTDDRVKAIFAEWAEAGRAGLRHREPRGDRLAGRRRAARPGQGRERTLMGNFAVAVFKDGGMTDEQLGFMPFPTINPGRAARRGCADRHRPHPAGAKNKEDAKLFLAYLATPEVQTKINEALGPAADQQPRREVGDDPFLQAGFELLSTRRGGIAQFFDRDAPAEMAKVGMEGFQEFMVKPDNVDAHPRAAREGARRASTSDLTARGRRSGRAPSRAEPSPARPQPARGRLRDGRDLCRPLARAETPPRSGGGATSSGSRPGCSWRPA